MLTVRVIFFVFISFLLAACANLSNLPKPSFLKYRDTHYLAARSIQPLKIPPGVSSTAISNEYPIPDKQYAPVTKEVSVVPPGFNNE